jgi:uncharacterized protein YciI
VYRNRWSGVARAIADAIRTGFGGFTAAAEARSGMTEATLVIPATSRFWVVTITLRYRSVDEARQSAPELLAEHMHRARSLHAEGRLLMAGAFLDEPGPLRSMGVLLTREDALDFLENDPFVQAGMASDHSIRPWANMFAQGSAVS